MGYDARQITDCVKTIKMEKARGRLSAFSSGFWFYPVRSVYSPLMAFAARGEILLG